MIFDLYNLSLKKILDINTISLSPAKRVLIRSIQILVATIRDITGGQLNLRAMSLVYTTLITLVPLLALSFSVLKGFNVHKEIEGSLLAMLEALGPEKSSEVTSLIISFVDNIEVGVLGTVGLALLIYAVISLMQKIESAFNYIWRVSENRSFAKRFSDYLTVLLVGPLFIFISAGITTTIRHSSIVKSIESQISFPIFYDVMGVLLPWFVLSIGFAFIYMFMPNTKVKVRFALIGGMFAALIWKIMGWLFFMFIAGAASYIAIYAAFATLIILMIWLYLAWLVILIGVNISFYAQNHAYLKVSRGELVISPRLRRALALGILSIIGKSYYNSQEQKNAEQMSEELNMPVLAVQNILNILEEKEFIITNRQDPPKYFPAKSFNDNSISQVIESIDSYGEDEKVNMEEIIVTDNVRSIINKIDIDSKEISNKKIRELIGSNSR